MRRTRIEPPSSGEMNFLFICMLVSFLGIGIGSKLGFTPPVITFVVIFGACAVGMIIKFVVNEASQRFFNNGENDSEEVRGSRPVEPTITSTLFSAQATQAAQQQLPLPIAGNLAAQPSSEMGVIPTHGGGG